MGWRQGVGTLLGHTLSKATPMNLLLSQRQRGSCLHLVGLGGVFIGIATALSGSPDVAAVAVFCSVGIVLVLGYLLRWGPLVPSFLLGTAVSVFMPAINRPAYSWLVDCLIWGTIGAIL